MVIIGLDPHPRTHTAAALNAQGGVIATLTVDNTASGLEQLQAWAAQYAERRWAIEGAGSSFTRPLCAQLFSRQEQVYSIHPGVTSQYRSRHTNAKNDTLDAEHVARALLANPAIPRLSVVQDQLELQNLTRNRERLAGDLKAHTLARRELPEGEAGQVMRDVLQTMITAIKDAIKTIEQQLKVLVQRQAPHLLDRCGIGVVLAATILAEVGDMRRFPSQEQFARFCGAAPVPRGSGGTLRWCVSRGGNRRLNRTLHLIAFTRCARDERTRTYMSKKRAEGKSTREALRALKTILARELFHALSPKPASASP